MSPKDPKLNGWKYYAVNLTDEEHKELTNMMNELCLMTGVHKKDIIKILVKNKLSQLKQKEK